MKRIKMSVILQALPIGLLLLSALAFTAYSSIFNSNNEKDTNSVHKSLVDINNEKRSECNSRGTDWEWQGNINECIRLKYESKEECISMGKEKTVKTDDGPLFTRCNDDGTYAVYDSSELQAIEDKSVQEACPIKGNIGFNTGEKIYHVPGQLYYESTSIDESYGEKWFCSEEQAIAEGWRKSYE